MEILSQQDPRWASDKIGTTNYPLGRWGCTITCIAMLSGLFGCSKNPAELAKLLRYTDGALLIWGSITEKLCFSFQWRFYSNDTGMIDRELRDLKRAVILEVNKPHWVVAVGKTAGKDGEYDIFDPIDGTVTTTARYNNNITGGAILEGERKKPEPSDWAKEDWDFMNEKKIITNSNPMELVSKQWVAVVVKRMYDLLKK